MALTAALAATLSLPRGQLVWKPVLRYGRGGRWRTPQGARFAWLMENP